MSSVIAQFFLSYVHHKTEILSSHLLLSFRHTKKNRVFPKFCNPNENCSVIRSVCLAGWLCVPSKINVCKDDRQENERKNFLRFICCLSRHAQHTLQMFGDAFSSSPRLIFRRVECVNFVFFARCFAILYFSVVSITRATCSDPTLARSVCLALALYGLCLLVWVLLFSTRKKKTKNKKSETKFLLFFQSYALNSFPS